MFADLAGCSSQSNGSISGIVGYSPDVVGEPDVWVSLQGKIRVAPVGGGVVQTLRTGKAGTFRIVLRPGRYTVEVKIPKFPNCRIEGQEVPMWNYSENGHATLVSGVVVVVRSGLDFSLKHIECLGKMSDPCCNPSASAMYQAPLWWFPRAVKFSLALKQLGANGPVGTAGLRA